MAVSAGGSRLGRMKFRYLHTASDLAPLGPDRAAAAFAAADTGANPDGMRSFVKAIRSPGWDGKPWTVMEFLKEGKKTRERSVGDNSHDFVYDGDLLSMRANAGRQVTVMGERGLSKIGRISFDLFRPVPAHGVSLRVIEVSPSRVRLADEGLEYTVNPGNGLIESALMSNGGVVQKQILTAGAVTYPGGVTMAPAIAVLEYSGGKLKRAEVAVVEEAEFNGSLPEDSFVMSVTAGTVVVDARYQDQKPKVAGGAIRDIAGRLREQTTQPTVPLTSSPSNKAGVYLYSAIGAALIMVAAWLGWRRYAKSNRSQTL